MNLPDDLFDDLVNLLQARMFLVDDEGESYNDEEVQDCLDKLRSMRLHVRPTK